MNPTKETPEEPKGFTVNAGNGQQVFEQIKRLAEKERMRPAQQIRQCSGCLQFMSNQAESVTFIGGVLKFYCESCATKTLYGAD